MQIQVTIPEGFKISNGVFYFHKNKQGTIKHELITIQYYNNKYLIGYRGPKKHQINLVFTLDSLENLSQELEDKIMEYKLERL